MVKRVSRAIRFVAILAVALGVAAPLAVRTTAAAEVASPLSPAESLKHLQTDTGLRIELVASEPQIVDPVAMRFDESGRLWVVEMRDYPNGPQAGGKPMSTIKVLDDRDGDGHYETAKTFADELLFATGLQPWRGGVIVTLSGQIIFLKDTNGDDRADLREVWYTGFKEENPQLRANHPRLTLGGKVVVANGLRGGAVSDPRRPQQKEVSISGMDFSFDPATGDCEAIAGNGQFGNTFDDFGRRFVCSNRNPVIHVVLDNRYLARNPFQAVPAVMADAAPFAENSHVYPRVKAWTTSNLHAGQFTAACGVAIYRGDALPAAYRGNSFTCEPTGSLIHREVLLPSGAAFTSQPSDSKVEFLTSDDPWFRPVNLDEGPDGALYVVDMYRAVIEHPQFMPEELKNRPDMRLGDDRGRIYRVVSADRTMLVPKVKLSDFTTPQLIAMLDHANAWNRETVARLILERSQSNTLGSPAETAAAGEQLVATGRTEAGRVQGLWILRNLGDLHPGVITKALHDPSPRVREHAVLLAEPFLKESPSLVETIRRLAADPDARLRFQVAMTLGGVASADVEPALAKIAVAGADDVWTRRAVGSALPEHAGPVLLAILDGKGNASGAKNGGINSLLQELSAIVAARKDAAELSRVLTRLCATDDSANKNLRRAALLGLAQGFERRRSSLSAALNELPSDRMDLKSQVSSFFAAAAAVVADAQQSEEVRGAEIVMLRYAPADVAKAALWSIIDNPPSQELQLKAIDAISVHANPEVAARLLDDFQGKTPAVRRAVLDAVIDQPDCAALLLDGIEAKQLAASEIDPLRTKKLLQSRSEKIRTRAAKLLAANVPADRKKVLDDYQVTLTLKGSPLAGKEIFRKNCSACHKIGDVGVNVAPDISDSRVKKPEQILTDILNPNRAIDNNYIAYSVVTVDGKVLTGIIVTETAASITLKQPENKIVSLLRSDIEMIRSSGISLMPEGLEKAIPPQDMANVISFIKNWRYLDQDVPAGTQAN